MIEREEGEEDQGSSRFTDTDSTATPSHFEVSPNLILLRFSLRMMIFKEIEAKMNIEIR